MERDYLKTPERLRQIASWDTSLVNIPDSLKNVVGDDTYIHHHNIPVEGNTEVVQPELGSVHAEAL